MLTPDWDEVRLLPRTISIDGSRLIARVPTLSLTPIQRESLKAGKTLYLTFDSRVMHFFGEDGISLLTDADYRRQLELKKESQKQEIIEALASSGKSYNEIMSFLLGKEKK